MRSATCFDINLGFLYQENLESVRLPLTLETKFLQPYSVTDHIHDYDYKR